MPPSTDQIPDQPTFDVYAMLLILSFLFTAGASGFLFDDLCKNWGFWDENKETMKLSTSITQINDDPEKYPDTIAVRKRDLEDRELALKHLKREDPFPHKNWEWPEGYKPLEFPVMPNQDNLTKIPAEQIQILIKDATPAVEEKKTDEKPTPEAPKDEKKEEKKEEKKPEEKVN